MKKMCMMLIIACGSMLMAQRPGPGDQNPANVLARYFDFDETQQSQLTELMDTRRSDSEPIVTQISENRHALGEMLNGDDPDATAIGQTMLFIKDLEGQLFAVQQAFGDGFTAMLTEDQAQKLGALTLAKRLIPVVHAAEQLRLPLRPPQSGE